MKKAWLLMVVLCGCGEGRVANVHEDFFVEQTRIDLGRIWVGHEHRVAIPVESRSRFDLRLRAGGDQHQLPAGATTTVLHLITATEPGTVEERLLISGEKHSVEVTIVAQAATVSKCTASSPCVRAFFDLQAGACVEEPLGDDTACGDENSCVANGQCRAGQCVGDAVNCDDANACTDDACSVGVGCVHADSSARCEATVTEPVCTDDGLCLEPCVAAYCDPLSGCQTAAVADGTSCGPSDCATAHVCMSGVCEARAVPEGSACGADSPCQARGQCIEGTCQQAPPAVLAASWTYVPSSANAVVSRLALNEQGALVFAECATGCVLVSLTQSGALRFRTTMTDVTGVRELALGNGRVFATTTDGELRIHHGGTGVALANVDVLAQVRADLNPLAATATETSAQLRSLAADGTGRVYVLAQVHSLAGETSYDRGSFLVALDDRQGTLLWKRKAHHFAALVVDERGHLFTGEWLGTQSSDSKLLSLNPDGSVRYGLASFDSPLLAQGGQLLTSNGWVYDVASGAKGVSIMMGGMGDWLAARGTSTWMVEVMECFPAEPSVIRVSNATGALLWRTQLDPSMNAYVTTGPLLTQTDSVLVTLTRPTEHVLTEVSSSGGISLSCALGGTSSPRQTLLGDQRYFVTDHESTGSGYRSVLRAYDVPGRRPAVSGWVGPGGGPLHSSRPR